MNAVTHTHLSVPILHGLSLTVAPGHEKSLELAMPHLANIADAIYRFHSSPLLSEFMDTVLARFLRENDYTPKTAYMHQARMAKLKSVLTSANPGRRVAELGSADITAVKDELPKLLKLNSTSGSQGGNLQVYFQLFNRMLDEAAADRLIGEAIKIKGCKNTESKVTKAFLDSNLVSLFTSWPYQTYALDTPKDRVLLDAHSYCFWLMPLGLFTGARLNELCQLRAHDVIQDIHGVHLLSINANGFNKSLKNAQSEREIPICSKLISMGFLDFVDERRHTAGPDALLFSELAFDAKHLYSRAASRFFCGPVTGAGFIGLHCPVALEGGFNFKSFRRSFALRLEKSGVSSSTIAHLLGHLGGAPEVTSEHYLDKPLSLTLLEQLERGLSYNLPPGDMHWQHFKHLMNSQAGRKKRGRKAKKTLH
ncbi:tyrosine-type recombinase/integrase [Pseudomonas sp. URMO17WK12:I4]|uniref:tyrosine-type recombinase/integrase n=1 Tax=Pseudomonas sp. URMO17WK12:I4 TaxID=1283292 RepID=UPI00048156C4|nr:tyrosine-type recombinase/integrase [Pseudomonas sp. URMO17WK12:I4]